MGGAYFGSQTRTRVNVNGVDLGWHALNLAAPIALPAAVFSAADAANGTLAITLTHETPATAPGPDPRNMALFLPEISLR